MHKIYYTLTQAALATGQPESTILQALQSDKLPSTRNAHGNYKIAANDLHATYHMMKENNNSASHTNPQLESERAISQQKSEQINDLRNTIADLQNRLDKADDDRRQLETHRKQIDDNNDGQMNRLTQLLAMKEQTIKEHQLALQVEQSKPAPQLTRRKLTLTERIFGGEIDHVQEASAPSS